MNEIKELYRKKKPEIEGKLEEFKKKGESSDDEIFAELCFCILTPQSRALAADRAVREMKQKDILLSGTRKQIRNALKGVRFPNNKASYIVDTRERFKSDGKIRIKDHLREPDILKLRKEMVMKVKGYGLKEASHFLRNTGRGQNIAILDRHILSRLCYYKVIKKVPANISEKKYIQIEKKLKKFSSEAEVPLDALDLLFWYMQTGYFFK